LEAVGLRATIGLDAPEILFLVSAFIAPLIAGTVGEKVGYRFGFLAAGLAMVIGLVQFRLTGRYLGGAGLEPQMHGAEKTRNIRLALAGLAILVAAAVAAYFGLIQLTPSGLAWQLLIVMAGIAVVVFGGVLFFGGLDAAEKKRIGVIFVFFVCAALFWAGFEQAGSSLNLFAERFTLRDFAGFEIPASWFQSLNPTFIILLAPVYALLWVWLARRHLEPAAPAKFAFGLIILGLGFAVMIGAAALVAQGRQVWPTWLVCTYLLHTMGELALSPVGLSAMTKLAPRRFVGQMMGMWFMCTALGNAIAGVVAGTFDAGALSAWPGLYTQIVLTTMGSGLVLLVFSKPLRRLMGGLH